VGGNAISSSARDRAYILATKAANDLDSGLDRSEVAELYGMPHLSAALASTVAGRFDQATTHIHEAESVAGRPGVGSTNFGYLAFGVGTGIGTVEVDDSVPRIVPAERIKRRADGLDESVQHHASCRWMRCTSAAPQPRTTTGRQDTNAVISQGARSTPAAVSRW
jgi:hypothetical protein